ncbi:DUF937 domain-containing protein [Microbacterium terricola]|uniref:DUF937 domain-containing protein n=1 Tax=Microbacterium terricola TaxID=344163 RepID=A0ABM8DV99_9MICO|nr:DUF937 domain-containing protein [Microbacterium terricola]UYK39713.1 DUF937 domain-containing protein [Microbacterium terricola]BDV29542.1 hypothetical protein Microterr_02020 [Microbacterium terricola]
MAGIDDILDSLPIDQIASKLGVDPAVAKKAVQEGGATILGGLQRNAATPEGAAAIRKAAGAHAGQDAAVDLDAVDTEDGEKILGHVFGDKHKEVAQKLTDEPQTAGVDFGALLPMLAPIVMGLIAKRGGAASGSEHGAEKDAGGIGDVIGGLLGGASGSAGGFDVGGLLGGLFGGKK